MKIVWGILFGQVSETAQERKKDLGGLDLKDHPHRCVLLRVERKDRKGEGASRTRCTCRQGCQRREVEEPGREERNERKGEADKGQSGCESQTRGDDTARPEVGHPVVLSSSKS